jgi:hypothetical protein
MNQPSQHIPASPSEAKGALKALFEAFPADRGEGTLAVGTYLIAIEGYPLSAIELAVKRLIRGEFEDVDRRFLPTPAQLSNSVAYCAKVLEPPPKRLALPAPGSEVLTEDEVTRRQALAAKARERFGIKTTQGETVIDRDAITEAKRAELDLAVKVVADRIKAEGLPMLSDEAKALFRERSERAVPSPDEQFDEWDRRTPSHLPRKEEAA